MAAGFSDSRRSGIGALAPDVIARIRDGYADLSPSEQAVADAVLSDVRGAVEASNAAIAAKAGVSQPTVTRFCRSVGCTGVRDFKLALTRSLVVGDIYLAAEGPADGPPERGAEGMARPPFWDSVLNEARAALRAVEQQLDPALVIQGAERLAEATRVVTLGLGGSSSTLAEEAQVRLFRLGLPVVALRDPYVARMTVATLRPGAVLLAVSATGRTREVIEATALARHYGATTLAITATGSDLAQAAHLALTYDVLEYPDTLKPTATRFAALAVIDLLAAATGYRMGPAARETLRRIKRAILIHRPGAVMEPLGD
jgi:RpiR family carbohydrate utilization transcriptional regulator